MFKLEKQDMKNGYSMLLYSDAGVGKTWLLGNTLPVGKSLIIDVEGGIYVIGDTGHLCCQLKDWNDTEMMKLDEMYAKLSTGYVDKINDIDYKDIKFVCLDSLSELYKWFQFYYLAKSGKTFFTRDVYGKASQKLREYIRNFRNLTYKGINVIFTCVEEDLNIASDGGSSDVKKTYPKLSGSFTREVNQLVDLVGHLEIINQINNTRGIRFKDNGVFYAKSRISYLDPIEGAHLGKLFIKILGGKK